MFGTKRALVTETLRTATLPGGRSRRVRVGLGQERGSAAVELALTIPILMIMVTGICSFGSFLQQYIELTDAVNVGALWLSVNRSNQDLDPCNLAYTAVINAAPDLPLSGSNFKYNFNGNAESGSSCSSPTSNSGAPSYMVEGTPVTVTVSNYPCSLGFWGTNLVPGCSLSVSMTEIMQ